MSDNAFDLDARISSPVQGGGQLPTPSISSLATRTICTRVGCKVTSTCVCTSLCTSGFCSNPQQD
ncbi:FDLD family class I lanthipeptide [Streptomyces sp. CBMA123]|uniref:FDLD family class I lanthipeptide n=1 Tax=Streptomyces sp. CBMA123 TaxID=1896313 RepID=UPI001661DB28|nr:FDLD family class I lanthipeptide [Streptomyces sp. CBMA123]MBD0695383.1 hypothetical protein [Streptomyces sp. CBMA123]